MIDVRAPPNGVGAEPGPGAKREGATAPLSLGWVRKVTGHRASRHLWRAGGPGRLMSELQSSQVQASLEWGVPPHTPQALSAGLPWGQLSGLVLTPTSAHSPACPWRTL